MAILGRAISVNSMALGAFALVTTATIAATYLGTREAIIKQERAARAKALLQIVPRERHDNSLLDATIPLHDTEWLSLDGPADIFFATNKGMPVAFIIPAIAPDGYSGVIKLITGINIDGSIAGVRVLAHSETPGLGDRVDLNKSDWVLGFDDKSLRDPLPEQWKVKKDQGAFDQFTGATITPRAVTAAVYRSLMYFQINKKALLDAAKPAAKAGTTTSEPIEDKRDA